MSSFHFQISIQICDGPSTNIISVLIAFMPFKTLQILNSFFNRTDVSLIGLVSLSICVRRTLVILNIWTGLTGQTLDPILTNELVRLYYLEQFNGGLENVFTSTVFCTEIPIGKQCRPCSDAAFCRG